MADIKMVLVVRKDLNMRKGKIAAQCGHAATGATLQAIFGSRLFEEDFTFGDDGWLGFVADSRVVTSSTFVTALIFSAATSRTVFAISQALCASVSVTEIEITRVSVGIVTAMSLESSLADIESFSWSITDDKTSLDVITSL